MEQRIIPSCLPGLKPVLREQVIATRIDVQIYELLYDPPVATRDIEKGQGLKICVRNMMKLFRIILTINRTLYICTVRQLMIRPIKLTSYYKNF